MKYNHLISLSISLMVLVLGCYSTAAGGQKGSGPGYTYNGPVVAVYLPNFVRPHPGGKQSYPKGAVLYARLASNDNHTAVMQYYIVPNADYNPSPIGFSHTLPNVTFDFHNNIDDIKFRTEANEVRVIGHRLLLIRATKVTKCDPNGNLGYDVKWN